nr:PREDICTED: uncharacterized protein LOC105663961 [Megachile rotundata]
MSILQSDPHVLALAIQGAHKKTSTTPPPMIRATIAKIVHEVEDGITRAERSLLAVGSSVNSSVLKPSLLALLSKNLNRRDAFSQDIFDVVSQCIFQDFSNCEQPHWDRIKSFVSLFYPFFEEQLILLV